MEVLRVLFKLKKFIVILDDRCREENNFNAAKKTLAFSK